MSKSVTDAVTQLLWNDAAFQAASPGGTADTVLPEGATLPATTYQVVGGRSDATLDTSGMQKLRVQFDCRAATADDAATARDALIAALNGRIGETLEDGTWLDSAELIQTIDYFDSDSRQFRKGVEFYVNFNFPS